MNAYENRCDDDQSGQAVHRRGIVLPGTPEPRQKQVGPLLLNWARTWDNNQVRIWPSKLVLLPPPLLFGCGGLHNTNTSVRDPLFTLL